MPEVRRPGRQSFRLGGKSYLLVDSESVDGGKRAWSLNWESDQPAAAEPFEIEIGNQSLGAGITYADAPHTYETAAGLDFSPLGFATWPGLGFLTPFITASGAYPAKAVFHGGYLYVFRAGHVAKYQPSVTPGASWGILEFHFLGTGNQYTGGNLGSYDGDLYCPVRATGGSYQVFQRLSTVSVTVTETQTVAISGTPSGGTYTITFNDGFGAARTTAAIAWDATSPVVQAALRLLPGLELVTVAQSGSSPNFTHTVTMTGAPSAAGTTSPPQFTSTSSLTGGAPVISHATTVSGTGDRWDLGPAGKEAQAFVHQADALVRGKDNVVSKALADPLVGGNWGAEYEVGDFDSATLYITDLATYPGGDLVVGRTDGVWVVNPSNIGESVIPEIEGAIDAENCLGMSYAQGYILIPHYLGLLRWRPGAWSIVGIEPDDLFEPDAGFGGWGRVRSIAPWGRRTYMATDNPGATVFPALLSLSPGGVRVGSFQVHMHALGYSDGARGAVATGVSATGGTSFLCYVQISGTTQVSGSVFNAGSMGLIPALDPNVVKLQSGWSFRSSRYVAPNRRVQKTYLEVEGHAEIVTDGNTSVEVQARVDGGNAFHLLLTPTGAASNLLSSGRFRRYFPISAGSVGKDVRIELSGASSGGTGASVRIRDLSIRGTYDPRATAVITAYVHAETGAVGEDGTTDGRSLERLLAGLRQLRGGDSLTTQAPALLDPWGRAGYVKVLEVTEEELRYKGEAKAQLVVRIKMRQVDA